MWPGAGGLCLVLLAVQHVQPHRVVLTWSCFTSRDFPARRLPYGPGCSGGPSTIVAAVGTPACQHAQHQRARMPQRPNRDSIRSSTAPYTRPPSIRTYAVSRGHRGDLVAPHKHRISPGGRAGPRQTRRPSTPSAPNITIYGCRTSITHWNRVVLRRPHIARNSHLRWLRRSLCRPIPCLLGTLEGLT